MWVNLDPQTVDIITALIGNKGVVLEDADVAKALADWDSQLALHTDTESLQDYVDVAKAAATEGELEVDDDAVVSIEEVPNPSGAYVMCWMWVENGDADVQEETVHGEQQSSEHGSTCGTSTSCLP